MNSQSFVPAHRMLCDRNNDFWETYWDCAELTSYLDKVATMTQAVKAQKAKRVFVISKDRAWFLAGVYAALYADLPVVLAQSDAPELLVDLIQEGDVLLSDQQDLAALTSGYISMQGLENQASPAAFKPLNPQTAKIIFYTSGSSGNPKAIEKRLSHIEAEISVLQDYWGPEAQSRFLSTVSHHHLYAFLYSLLWPICGGYPMVRHTFTYWGELFSKSVAGDVIISSPAHLGRFSILEDCKLKNFKHVFSSGAPLSYDAATLSKSVLGSLPIEVYGSTETGGCAFRQQEDRSTPWKPFVGVTLSSDSNDKLKVKSAYIEEPEYQTEDLVSWVDDNSFHLLGRADRIVKIEGKRVSLVEIERKLKDIDYIEDAAVLLLEKSYRDEVGAVIVLTDEGEKTLQSKGKPWLAKKLRSLLSSYFDKVLVPRKWRFVNDIEVNAQGKRTVSKLKNLFANTSREVSPLVRHPIILDKKTETDQIICRLQIPEDLSYLEGHFKDMPIVPGVVQLHWVAELAQDCFNLSPSVHQASQIKFTNLLRPKDIVHLTLSLDREKSVISYRFHTNDKSYSSGRLHFLKEVVHGL